MALLPRPSTLRSQCENLPTPTGEQAPINTPEASRGTVSNVSIAQKDEGVKSQSDSAGHRLSDSGEQNAPMGRNPIYGKDIVTQDVTAPVRSDISIQEDVQEYQPFQSEKDMYAEREELDDKVKELIAYGNTLTDHDEIKAVIDRINAIGERMDELDAAIKEQADSLTVIFRFTNPFLGRYNVRIERGAGNAISAG